MVPARQCAIFAVIAVSLFLFLFKFPWPFINDALFKKLFISIRIQYQQFSALDILIQNRNGMDSS